MECLMTGTTRCCNKPGPWVPRQSGKQELEALQRHHQNVSFCHLQLLPKKFGFLHPASVTFTETYGLARVKKISLHLISTISYWRTFAVSVNLENEHSSVSEDGNSNTNSDFVPKDSSQDYFSQPLDVGELNLLLADSARAKLITKLSEANQHNRYLKRQLQVKEDALVKCKNELAVMEFELQALIGLAEEVAKSGMQYGSRKINGKYIMSHLLSRLQELRDKLKKQMGDVDTVKFVEVPLCWYGMAESVQVMGSFDGWSQGEQMSPEYTGGFNKFSTTLKLRPGRYEIKFLVDGSWKLCPEFPTTGKGPMENNLLVVE